MRFARPFWRTNKVSEYSPPTPSQIISLYGGNVKSEDGPPKSEDKNSKSEDRVKTDKNDIKMNKKRYTPCYSLYYLFL